MDDFDQNGWADQVLGFWFNEVNPSDWFSKSDTFDRSIRDRFGGLHTQLSARETADFLTSPHEALAAIILFDQFSRNLFRGDPRSFASDPLALNIARQMVAKDWDQSIAQEGRIFVYLPFEHSEDLGDQNRSVELIEALGDDTFTRYARAHRDVVTEFGRFPHRNTILGRASTRAEMAYLQKPGSGF